MDARRAVAAARRSGEAAALRQARDQVNAAKLALGERGPVWWTDGAPDLNRHLVRNTPYASWFAERNGKASPDDAAAKLSVYARSSQWAWAFFPASSASRRPGTRTPIRSVGHETPSRASPTAAVDVGLIRPGDKLDRNVVELCLRVVEMAAAIGDGYPAAGCPEDTVGTHIRAELGQ